MPPNPSLIIKAPTVWLLANTPQTKPTAVQPIPEPWTPKPLNPKPSALHPKATNPKGPISPRLERPGQINKNFYM